MEFNTTRATIQKIYEYMQIEVGWKGEGREG